MATSRPKAASRPAKRILVVEDEYLIAEDLANELRALGAEVVGPVPSLARALSLLAEGGGGVDLALLDINLDGELGFPIADLLIERGTRIVFTTGYDEFVIPGRYAHIPRCGKPITRSILARMLTREGE